MLHSKAIRLACLLSVSTVAVLISATQSFSQETSLPYFVKSFANQAKPNTEISQIQPSFRNSDLANDRAQTASPPNGSAGANRNVLTGSEKMKFGARKAFLNPG